MINWEADINSNMIFGQQAHAIVNHDLSIYLSPHKTLPEVNGLPKKQLQTQGMTGVIWKT